MIRHFAALLVLYSHHYALLKQPEPIFLNWDTYGTLAVLLFFSISGYFMPISFICAGNFVRYMIKRIRRIFPGLTVCMFCMYYLIGSLFVSSSALSYLLSPNTLVTTLTHILSMHGPKIPGVFTDFLYPEAINGSLWTLPIEFIYYIMLGLLLSLSTHWRTIAYLVAGFILLHFISRNTWINQLYYANKFHLYYLTLFGLAFSGGALLSALQKYWLVYKNYLLILSVTSLLFFSYLPCVLKVINLTLLTITFALTIPDSLIKRKFDISYGIYIYAFPIQQITINLITADFIKGMLLAIFFTILAGFFSYYFVEKPFLKPKIKKNNERMKKLIVRPHTFST
ncbi:acyltransferase family protein [Legionella clemsonensis]|nr:acyltransferase [Legionella clemsonensis]